MLDRDKHFVLQQPTNRLITSCYKDFVWKMHNIIARHFGETCFVLLEYRINTFSKCICLKVKSCRGHLFAVPVLDLDMNCLSLYDKKEIVKIWIQIFIIKINIIKTTYLSHNNGLCTSSQKMSDNFYTTIVIFILKKSTFLRILVNKLKATVVYRCINLINRLEKKPKPKQQKLAN